jgi:CubicO group peptidase (beta-lactamase class C family)
MNRFYFIAIIILSLWSSSVFSQSPIDLNIGIEGIAKKYVDSIGVVGMSVAVIQDNELKFKKSFGYANVEFGIPMSNASVYRIWSISKQFCAVSILKLEEEEKIKLSDPIGQYLDSVPETWKPIKIEQLLNNTAGIKDYLNDYPDEKLLIGHTYEQVVDSVKFLLFEPGEQWSYSNSNFWVLTKIIEEVTSMPYQDYLKANYFEVYGLNNTRKMDFSSIIPNRVNGYRLKQGTLGNSSRYLDERYYADGDGELMSTIDDLVKWSLALMSGEIISKDQLELAWEKARLNNGKDVNGSSIIYYDENVSYGYGWFISELEGLKTVWTPGAGPGFSTTHFTIPEKDLSIIVLCNRGKFLVADQIAKDIAIEIMSKN